MRPIALNRKNALFAGHDAGAQNWAMLASIIETCKLNKVEPHAYMTSVLTAIAQGHKQKYIKQLLPWNFGKLSTAYHQLRPYPQMAGGFGSMADHAGAGQCS